MNKSCHLTFLSESKLHTPAVQIVSPSFPTTLRGHLVWEKRWIRSQWDSTLALWLWISFLVPLSLDFLICKMGTTLALIGLAWRWRKDIGQMTLSTVESHQNTRDFMTVMAIPRNSDQFYEMDFASCILMGWFWLTYTKKLVWNSLFTLGPDMK